MYVSVNQDGHIPAPRDFVLHPQQTARAVYGLLDQTVVPLCKWAGQATYDTLSAALDLPRRFWGGTRAPTSLREDDDLYPASYPGDLDDAWEKTSQGTRRLMAQLSRATGAEAILAVIERADDAALAELPFLDVRGYDLSTFTPKVESADDGKPAASGRFDVAQTRALCERVAVKCPRLARIEAYGLKLDVGAAQALATLPSLTRLDLSDSDVSEPGVLKALSGCQNIARLDLYDTDLPAEGLGDLSALPHLKHLRVGSEPAGTRGPRSLHGIDRHNAEPVV